MSMEVKIGVQNAARELSVDTDESPDDVLKSLETAISDEAVFSLTDAKGRTVAVPADKVAYLYFTADSTHKVGFGLVTGT
jgi:hypothetical protein